MGKHIAALDDVKAKLTRRRSSEHSLADAAGASSGCKRGPDVMRAMSES